MKERAILECIRDMSDMMYHRTGDKWYLALGLDTTRKLRSKGYEAKDIQAKKGL